MLIDPEEKSSEVKRKKKDNKSAEKCKKKARKRSRSRSRDERNHQRWRFSNSRSPSPQPRNKQAYRSDPVVQKIVKKMVSEQVSAISAEIAELKKQLNQTGKLKSLSDSTLYTPAVPRVGAAPNCYTPTGLWVDAQDTNNKPSNKSKEQYSVDLVNQVLCDLHFGTGNGRGQGQRTTRNDRKPQPSTSRAQPHEVDYESTNEQRQSDENTARRISEEAILQAERFKAQIQPPTGMTFSNPIKHCNNNEDDLRSKWEVENQRYLRYLESDDDEFFHTTCHIDESIRKKIEKGEFVELEKLLQKRTHFEPQEKRLQLVSRDGESYFVPPVDKETKIDSVKKWETAFRVYITIYCSANPQRSGEVLQYVDVIHRAAKIFSWDNVARYDYVFRQLMAAKPHRSWAKTYTQMWNLTLNEPIKKFNDQGSNNNNNSHNTYRGSNGQKKRIEGCCWRFNKNNCSYGKSCKFDHKCSYCGSFSHPFLNCNKRRKSSDKGEKGEKGKN